MTAVRRPGEGVTLARRALAVSGLLALGYWLIASTESARVADVMPFAVVALLLPVVPLILDPEGDIFSPAVFTGVAGFIGMLGIVLNLTQTSAIEYGDLSLSRARAEEVTRDAFLIHILSSATYLAGFYGWKRGLGRRLLPDVSGSSWNRQRLLLVSALWTGCFVIAYGWFQARLGGSLLSLSLKEGKAILRDDPTLSWVVRGIGLGQIPILFYGAIAAAQRNRRALFVVLLAALVTAFLSLRTGGRGLALFFLASGLVTVHYLYRRIRPWTFALGIMAALVLSNALGQLRQEGGSTMERPTSLRPAEVIAEHEEERQRLVPMVAVVDYFPQRHDYLLGSSWIGLFTSPIPRWVWPEKGLNEWDRWRDTNIARELSGVPAPTPLPFVLYANFGPLGVAVGMLLWGAFHRALSLWRKAREGDANTQLLYAMILFYFGPTLLQVSATLQWGVPMYITILFVRRRSSARSRAIVVDRPQLAEMVK